MRVAFHLRRGDNQRVVPDAQVPTRETAARPSLGISVVSVTLVVALTSCGGSKPAVCSSVDNFHHSVQNMRAVPEYLASSPSDVGRKLPAVESDLAKVKADAKSELSSQIDAVESSLAKFRTSLEAARVRPSTQTLRVVHNRLATFETDVATLIRDTRSRC